MVRNMKQKEGRFVYVSDGQKLKLGSDVGLSAIVNSDLSFFELLSLSSACWQRPPLLGSVHFRLL
jgi:hypothetical protein